MRASLPSRSSLPLLLALAALGCSSKTGEVKGKKLSTVEAFCTEWAERVCSDDVVDRCSAASAEACQSTQAAFCGTLVDDGEYSSLTAKDCLAAVEEAYEDTKLTREERALTRSLGGACDRIRSGTGGVDAPCAEDSDCNRDIELRCITKAGSASGTCQEPVVVMGGFDCSAKDATCAEGFFCDGDNCIRGEAVGDTCSAGVPCADDLQCVEDEGSAADAGPPGATCQERRAVGSDCEADEDCASRICSPRVGTATGVCSAAIVLAPTEPTCIDLQ